MTPISLRKRWGTSWNTAPLPMPSASMATTKTLSAIQACGRPKLAMIKAAAATMVKYPGEVDTRICDVTNPASVKETMKGVLDVFGRVDGCFANAGIGGGGRKPFIDRSEEEWRKMFATNLDGVFHVFQATARHMTERATAGDPFGRLVATSSLASLFGTARNEHYAATKAGLEGAAATLMKEAMFHGVRFCVIHPGFTDTPMVRALGEEYITKNILPYTQLRRLIRAEEIADAICFMIGNSAVSGELWADAGWHPSA